MQEQTYTFSPSTGPACMYSRQCSVTTGSWRLSPAAPASDLTLYIFCLENSFLQGGPGHLLRHPLRRAGADLRTER